MAEENNFDEKDIVDDWLKLAKAEDRGALAALRRGANPSTENQAWPLVARWCGGLCNERSRKIILGCAAAFAFYPEHSNSGNFGESLRQLALKSEGKPDESIERFAPHFRRLLNIDDAGELAMRIPAFVRRCERNGIPVNYYRLLKDIHYWGEFSQLKWADAYWNKRKGGEDEK